MMGSRFNYSSPVASGGQQYNRHLFLNGSTIPSHTQSRFVDADGERLNANGLPLTLSRSLEGSKSGRVVSSSQNVAIRNTNEGHLYTVTNHSANYTPASLVKCSNCDNDILLSNAFKVDSSAFCDACCYSEKMKVSQILLCIYCRKLFVLSSREAKTHGKFLICSSGCHQKFALEYPYCCLGCGEFFHHLPFLSQTLSSSKVPDNFSFCSAKCHDEIENMKGCCVCGSTYYEVALVTIVLPDGRAKYCCSGNEECKSTLQYCLDNTCAYCNEVPRTESPLRLQFVGNSTMTFCEAACLRGYLDCRVQRPPKSSSNSTSVNVSQYNENLAAVIVNTQAPARSDFQSSSQAEASLSLRTQVGHPVLNHNDGRSHQTVNGIDATAAINNQQYNSVHTNELQMMVSRLASSQNSSRASTAAHVAGFSAERVGFNSSAGGSSIVIGTAPQPSALNTQARSIHYPANGSLIGSQAPAQQLLPVEEDDDDIQVINIIKETQIAATTAGSVHQLTDTVSVARSFSPPLSTESQRNRPEEAEVLNSSANKQSQNLFELLNAPEESSQPAQTVAPSNGSTDDPVLPGKKGTEAASISTGSEKHHVVGQVGPDKAESGKKDCSGENIAETEKNIVSIARGSTSVVSEQSCYTVSSAYKDIMMQSCASEPASDLSLIRNDCAAVIGSIDSPPAAVRNGAKLVACHACARSVATFEAYPSFCTGVQKSANQLFCSRTCRRKFQERFGLKKKCTMCGIERPVEEEIQLATDRKMVFCSTLCCYLFKEHYFRRLGLIFATCSFCGRNFSDDQDGKLVFATATEKYRFCCNKCKDNFKQWNMASRCDACLRNITSCEVKIFWRGKPKQFCDRKCMLTFYQQENSAVNEPFYGSETFKNSLKPILSSRRPKVKRRHVAIQCHPQHSNRMIQVAPRMREKGSSMDDDDPPGPEVEPSKSSYPLIIPVPVPVNVPIPCQLYSQPCPYPVPFLLPCALPVGLPEKVLFQKDLQFIETSVSKEASNDSFLIGRAIAASLVQDEQPNFRFVKQENDGVVNDYIDKLKSLEFNFDQEFDIVLHTSENSDLPLAVESKIEFLRAAFKLEPCLEWIKDKLIGESNLACGSNEDQSTSSNGNKSKLKNLLKRQREMMSSNIKNEALIEKSSKIAKVLHSSSDDDESESESESLASIQSQERGLRKQTRVDYKSMIGGVDNRKMKNNSNGGESSADLLSGVLNEAPSSGIKVDRNSESSDDARPLKIAVKVKEIGKHTSSKSCLNSSQTSAKLKHHSSSNKLKEKLPRKGENTSSTISTGSKSGRQHVKSVSKNNWTSKEMLSWTTKCCNCLIYTLGYIGKIALVNNLASDNFINYNSSKSKLEIENISDSCLDQILCLFLTRSSSHNVTTLEERCLTLRLLSLLFLQLFLKFFDRPKLLFFHRSYPLFQQALCEVRISPLSQGGSDKMANLRKLASELFWISGILGDSNAHSLQFTVLYHLFRHMKLTSLSQHKLLTKSHFSRSFSDDVIKSKEDETPGTSIVPAVKFRNHGTLNYPEERKMYADLVNPLRCPLKSYNAYLSKLPTNSVSLTVSLFYKEPHITYSQNSRLWYCNSRLNEKTLSVYLTLAKVIATDLN